MSAHNLRAGGSEGRHRLQLKRIGSPQPADAPNSIKVVSTVPGRWSTQVNLPDPTDTGPAVAAIGDIRNMKNATSMGKLVGGTWHSYCGVPGVLSTAGPALTVHEGKLYLATTDDTGTLQVTGYTGSAWETPVGLSGSSGRSPPSPAIAGICSAPSEDRATTPRSGPRDAPAPPGAPLRWFRGCSRSTRPRWLPTRAGSTSPTSL